MHFVLFIKGVCFKLQICSFRGGCPWNSAKSTFRNYIMQISCWEMEGRRQRVCISFAPFLPGLPKWWYWLERSQQSWESLPIIFPVISNSCSQRWLPERFGWLFLNWATCNHLHQTHTIWKAYFIVPFPVSLPLNSVWCSHTVLAFECNESGLSWLASQGQIGRWKLPWKKAISSPTTTSPHSQTAKSQLKRWRPGMPQGEVECWCAHSSHRPNCTWVRRVKSRAVRTLLHQQHCSHWV